MQEIDTLREIYHRLLSELNIKTFRSLYERFTWNDRLIGIIGPRGVGKTTLMLQLIKHHLGPEKAFYCSADHILFSQIRLWDLVDELMKKENIMYFFIDEIHHYEGWNQELKNIYDSFPKLTVVFSGSSSLDLIQGHYDLSRRGTIHKLPGLSFREYLNFQIGEHFPAIPFRKLLSDHHRISQNLGLIPRLLGHFEAYLAHGYYPFSLSTPVSFPQKVLNMIEKTIIHDIAEFYHLKTQHLQIFKKMLYFLTTTSPGTINVHHLAVSLRIDDKTALHYLTILRETGLVRILLSQKSGAALIRKPEKIYLDNPSLYEALSHAIGKKFILGTVREIFFLSSLENSGHNVWYGKEQGDFQIGHHIFEIGGRHKKVSSLLKNLFVVKDDLLIGAENTIPLYLFGFLY